MGSEETNFRFFVFTSTGITARLMMREVAQGRETNPVEMCAYPANSDATVELLNRPLCQVGGFICMVVCWDFFKFHEI